ncbi:MAG: phosphatase PAP2 family protein [Micromonosporaceae bacterium]|nr:phosphatase PAP2 family protein [Micromonosporaceae bacterium]
MPTVSTLSTQTGGPPEPLAGRRRVRRRLIGLSIWAAGFVAGWVTIGLPTEPVYLFGWLWAATIAWRSDAPWRVHLRFVRDWAPVVVLLVGYNLSRGFADTADPHVTELIVADRWLTGWFTGGQVPTIWLQQHLYHPDRVHWWDMLASWVYFSHFVLAIGVALVLWLRNRSRWAAFMRRFLFLCGAGLATYFAYPAAPPWWAYEHGYLGEVVRISTRGWAELGLHGAFNALNAGQHVSNPVAAMPSLHTAWALLVVAFFLPGVAWRWWPLLLSYPLAMALTLMYTGEHYLVDILAGWAYVGLAFLVVGSAERWWRRRRTRTAGQLSPAVTEPAPAPAGPG